MKTIEERADEYVGRLASSFLGFPEFLEGGKDGYIVGAAEQKQIDIEKACEWLKEHLGTDLLLVNHNMIEEFKKAMEDEE